MTDFYREAAYQGGLYSNGFIEFWWKLQIEPQRNGADGADWREQLPRHPLLDEFHTLRNTDLERVASDITVHVLPSGLPQRSAATWSNLRYRDTRRIARRAELAYEATCEYLEALP